LLNSFPLTARHPKPERRSFVIPPFLQQSTFAMLARARTTANGAPIIAPHANDDRDGDHDHPEHEAQATFSLPCTK
jgi:hypothetical protein